MIFIAYDKQFRPVSILRADSKEDATEFLAQWGIGYDMLISEEHFPKANYPQKGIDCFLHTRHYQSVGLSLVEVINAETWVKFMMPVKVEDIVAIEIPPLPKENPDSVIVTDPLDCEVHNWTLNAPIKVLRKNIDGMRDNNGYHIHVQSVAWNRPVYLHSSQYKLIEK